MHEPSPSPTSGLRQGLTRRRLATLLAGAALPFMTTSARADLLDSVQKAGVLRVAVVLDYPPFGLVDSNLKPQGYDIEFASHMAKALGVKLELVQVNAQSKIPTITAGKADLLLNIGRNPERAQVVDLTQPYAPYYIGVYGPADQKVSAVADLAGKKISVTRGTFEDQLITKAAGPDVQIARFEDGNGTITAFLTGQADLISIGNVVAAALIEKNPPRRPEQKFLLLNSPVCAAVNKGETRLLERVNAAIGDIKKNGSLGALARQWLKQPLPDNL